MGVISAVRSTFEKLARVWSQPLSQTPNVLFGGYTSTAGQDVTPDTALSLSAVFAAINLLSRTVSTLPLNVYRRYGRDKEPAVTHPAYRLLHGQPNPEMTAATFRRTLEWHRLLYGNCYAEISWAGNGKPVALWPIEPWRVKPMRDDQGNLYYQIDTADNRLPPEDIIHIPLLSNDGVVGRGWISYATESLGLGMASQEFAAAYFGNGAKPGMILRHPGTPTPEARKQMRQTWDERHQGASQSHGTAVLWGGWELSNDSTFTPEQSQLIEQRRFTTEEVSRWLGIPPHLLRDLNRATYSNIEQQGTDFLVYSLNPILIDYEQEFDRKLLWPPEIYCKHNVTALLRGDSAARSAFYREMFNIGVLSINEIRELEDRNPILGGDEHFVPLNLGTLTSLAAPPAPVEPPVDALPVEPTPAPQPAPPLPAPAPPPETPSPALATDPVKMGVVFSTLTRLQRVELNAILRQANKPQGFLTWVDQYYAKHSLRLAEALGPVFAVAGIDWTPTEAADTWVIGSRKKLFAVADSTTAKTFPAAIQQLEEDWKDRPKEFLARLEKQLCQPS